MSNLRHLHVTFEAGTARALEKLSRRKQIPDAAVITTPDRYFLGDLSEAVSGAARLRVLKAIDPARFDPWYGEPDWSDVFSNGIDAFWTTLQAWQGTGTLWYSSASAQEWCGLITALALAPPAARFDLINVHILPGKDQHASSDRLSLEDLKAALPYAAPLSKHDISDARETYDRLRTASLRFIRGGRLLAGDVDVHDADIEAELESDFQPGEEVVQRVFALHTREAIQADERFFAFRLKQMATSGVIEARGDAYELDTGEVRDVTPSPDMLDDNRLHILGTYAAIGLVKAHSVAAGKPIRNIIETRTLFPSLGPLATLNTPDARLGWFQSESVNVHLSMAIDTEEERAAMVREWHELWAKLERWSGPITVWMSSHSAADRSLQLAIAKHVRRAVAIDFVDVADPDVSNPPLPNVEQASADQIAAAARRARTLTDAEIASLRKDYDRLAASSKGLRYLKAGKLTEAPLDQFDKRILKTVSAKWRLIARVMDEVIAEEADEAADQADHFFWMWRFDALVAAGQIEVDRSQTPDWKVRRAARASQG